MKPEFWLDRWNTGQIGFHQSEYEHWLTRLFPARSPRTVFVPLCGKSRDMLWLLQQGHTVVGIELSSLACEQFFRENFDGRFRRQKRGDFEVFLGDGVTIFCGDFFGLRPEDLQGATLAYDRAALIALPPELRKQYVAQLARLLPRSGSEIFLIDLEYSPQVIPGPPFSVPDAEVRDLYGSEFVVDRLVREEDPEASAPHARFAGAKVFENVYLIKRR